MNPHLATTILAALALVLGVAVPFAWQHMVANRDRHRFPLRPWQSRMMMVVLGWGGFVVLFHLDVGLTYHPTRWPDLETRLLSAWLQLSALASMIGAMLVLKLTDPGARPDEPHLFI